MSSTVGTALVLGGLVAVAFGAVAGSRAGTATRGRVEDRPRRVTASSPACSART